MPPFRRKRPPNPDVPETKRGLRITTLSFENTPFVIIGASGGIGSALSRRLKSHGAQPILLGRSAAKLALLGEELGAQTQSLDASKADELEHAVAAFGP